MDTDILAAIRARIHSTDTTDHPEFLTACAVAGLAALEHREAERAHASNRETVRNGTSGPGVLEVTEDRLKLTQSSLSLALDDIADVLVAQRAAEDEKLKAEGLASLKDQAAGNLVDARGTLDTSGPTAMGAHATPESAG